MKIEFPFLPVGIEQFDPPDFSDARNELGRTMEAKPAFRDLKRACIPVPVRVAACSSHLGAPGTNGRGTPEGRRRRPGETGDRGAHRDRFAS